MQPRSGNGTRRSVANRTITLPFPRHTVDEQAGAAQDIADTTRACGHNLTMYANEDLE